MGHINISILGQVWIYRFYTHFDVVRGASYSDDKECNTSNTASFDCVFAVGVVCLWNAGEYT